MFLTEGEQSVYSWWEDLGIKEECTILENCVSTKVSSLEEVYFRAVFLFDYFQPTNTSNHFFYSPNELKNSRAIQRSQRKIGTC